VFLDVENLPLDRKDRLKLRIATLFGAAARRIALGDEQFCLGGVTTLAV
jgi:hypothetical protein